MAYTSNPLMGKVRRLADFPNHLHLRAVPQLRKGELTPEQQVNQTKTLQGDLQKLLALTRCKLFSTTRRFSRAAYVLRFIFTPFPFRKTSGIPYLYM